MPIITWDNRLALRGGTLPDIVPLQVLGATTSSGVQQVGVTASWRWRTSITLALGARDRVLATRKLLAALDGMASVLELPVWRLDVYAAVPKALANAICGGVPFSQNSGIYALPFSDGTGWDVPRGIESTLDVAADLGDQSITTSWAGWSAHLASGHYITVGRDLHQIVGVDGDALMIHPPLRRDHAAGTAVYTAATGLFRRADSGPLLPNLDLMRGGTVTLSLVEAWEDAA